MQPQSSIDILPGRNVTFTVTVSGMNLSFWWATASGAPLPDDGRFLGRQTDTLTVRNVLEPDEGSFRCTISNPAGVVETDSVYLTVCKSHS